MGNELKRVEQHNAALLVERAIDELASREIRYTAQIEELLDNIQSTMDSYSYVNLSSEDIDNYSAYEEGRKAFYNRKEQCRSTCTECGGDGKIPCSYCNGVGVQGGPFYDEWNGYWTTMRWDCDYCEGKGYSRCGACTSGSIYSYENDAALDN